MAFCEDSSDKKPQARQSAVSLSGSAVPANPVQKKQTLGQADDWDLPPPEDPDIEEVANPFMAFLIQAHDEGIGRDGLGVADPQSQAKLTKIFNALNKP